MGLKDVFAQAFFVWRSFTYIVYTAVFELRLRAGVLCITKHYGFVIYGSVTTGKIYYSVGNS